jgi:hypothetical protein
MTSTVNTLQDNVVRQKVSTDETVISGQEQGAIGLKEHSRFAKERKIECKN